ncbi:MAG: hypothetical protein IH820_05065 [Bacteroidetes bacterium]|nr:hypothetical protein [Bacteroidota bacterium]
MREAIRHWGWAMGLIGALGVCLHANAEPHASTLDDTPLHVFSKISRAVVAVGFRTDAIVHSF